MRPSDQSPRSSAPSDSGRGDDSDRRTDGSPRGRRIERHIEPMRFDRLQVEAGRLEYRDTVQSIRVDVGKLASNLRERVRGEVRFDDGGRALYATDASNYRQVPIGVVLPLDKDDVIATVATAREFGVPILARGGGTSLAGQCCNVAIVIDMSKYMQTICEIDPKTSTARVLPGTVLDVLRNQSEQYQLTFGPDPATHTHCTLGGMIGNNSCGIHSILAGTTADNVEELEILTYDGARFHVGPTSDEELDSIIAAGGRRGEIYAALRSLRDRYADVIRRGYPDIPRRVSGYNLDQLLPEKGFNVARALVGSECTLAIVLEARLRLVPSPPERALVVLGYRDVYEAGDHIPQIIGFGPIGIEGVDQRLTDDMRRKGLDVDLALLPEGGGWLLVEFGGDTVDQARERGLEMIEAIRATGNPPSAKLYTDAQEEERVWEIRESGLGATANVPGRRPTWEGWEDAAVPPERLGRYLREFRSLLDEFHYRGDLYGHFGQGCVHTRVDFDLQSAEGVQAYRRFAQRAAQLVVSYGGSLSGEHGDGQSRAELLSIMYEEELIEAFREFKRIWDPEGRMNPGKVIDAYAIDENLRLGTEYTPWEPETWFRFPDDEGSFAKATLRCVGVGKCRRLDTGTMCPSYMATREEEHSTRGRAHLLFEMFEGDVVPSDWNNHAVKEALDLCLACKACKGECPVNVDLATYKAEFLAHYFETNPRPRAAWSMGLIWWWARAGSLAPSLANFVSQTPPLSNLARMAAGVSQKRRIPEFARSTFRSRFRRHSPPAGAERPLVVLWPDTFSNHFHPEIAEDAVEVLESGGYRVEIPAKNLCCGRPLYDFGFLAKARQLLARTMEALRTTVDDGVPIIGLEPSCVSVFRDELVNLFPDDPLARRLSESVVLFSEFLDAQRERFDFTPLQRKAVVQGHCHHGAIMGMTSEERVLEVLGVDATMLDSGCCGMAGSFGFEKDKYEVSQRCGERVLLPAVRELEPGTLLIADGFSCREQITQNTEAGPLHLAQIAAMARPSRRNPAR